MIQTRPEYDRGMSEALYIGCMADSLAALPFGFRPLDNSSASKKHCSKIKAAAILLSNPARCWQNSQYRWS